MPRYEIQTTSGVIKLNSDSLSSAHEQAIMLGYTLSDIVPNMELTETTPKALELASTEVEEPILTKQGWPVKTTDKSCDVCGKECKSRKEIFSFGRMIKACDECYDYEKAKVREAEIVNFEATTVTSIPAVIESIVKNKVDRSIERAQALYNEERPAWVLANFESPEEMYEKLTTFILDLEELEFVTKTRKRAAYDSIKELHGRLSKAEREKLINDPNFKPSENNQFNRGRKKTGNATGTHTGERKSKESKAIEALVMMGLDVVAATKIVQANKV